jgi:hypothetical protein
MVCELIIKILPFAGGSVCGRHRDDCVWRPLRMGGGPAVKRVNGFWAISPCFTNPRSVTTTASYGANFERFSGGLGVAHSLKNACFAVLGEVIDNVQVGDTDVDTS